MLCGFTLLGILLIKVTGFGLPFESLHNPTIAGGDSGIILGDWVATELFGNGAMLATFSMLLGAGVILFTTGKSSTTKSGLSVADFLYRRTILLNLFGVITLCDADARRPRSQAEVVAARQE